MSRRTDQIAYPTVRYDDARAGIDWLREAFGAEELMAHEGDGGEVLHFELSFEGGIVMGGTTPDGSDPNRLNAKTGPSSTYLVIADPDAHFARAEKAGAEIVRPLTDQSYGSREYSALDPEGNVWSFGTYRPEVPDA